MEIKNFINNFFISFLKNLLVLSIWTIVTILLAQLFFAVFKIFGLVGFTVSIVIGFSLAFTMIELTNNHIENSSKERNEQNE